jgi:hypothetical protein
MKASVALGVLAFVILALPTSADAHKLKQVRRELVLKGYDQIEFTRTKFPVWVNACRGSKRLHLHVDWYGKVTVTNDTPRGSCPTEQENTVAVNTVETQLEPKDEPKTTKTGTENEKSTISAAPLEPEAEPKDEPMNVAVGCKKFFPAVGMTLTVSCE